MATLSHETPRLFVADLKTRPEEEIVEILTAMQEEWRRTLSWDMSLVVPVLVKAIREQIVTGELLYVDAQPAGLAFFCPEEYRTFIGECYVVPEMRDAQASRFLIRSLVRRIEATRPGVRIEYQSINFDSKGIVDALVSMGFERADRIYLEVDLDDWDRASDRAPISGVAFRSWHPTDYDAGVATIHGSYHGHIEALFNSQYRTVEGVADLIDALTGSFWCGRFDQDLAQVAVDERNGRCCGVALVSEISAETVHVSQIAVMPSLQGRGIGRILVDRVLDASRRRGYRRVTLVVTRENERALHLYLDCGFQPGIEFPVFYRSA